MNIVYSTSESYAEPTAISIYSLLTNNVNCKELNIYIIESSISKISRENLTDIATSFSRTINFIDADKVFKKVVQDYKLELLRGGYSTYARVFINHFLPKLDKAILIDSDSLVLQSLHELWEHNLNGAVIGAVPEAVVYGKNSFHEDPNLVKDCKCYYNMGIVLFDLSAWRAQNIEDILSHALLTPQKYFIADQSIINKYLSDKISRLPLKFNFYTFMHGLPSKEIMGDLLFKNVFDYLEIQTANHSPAIIHFVGNWFERPWYKRGHSLYKKIYLSYRDLTPYQNQKLWATPYNKRKLIRLLDEFISALWKFLPLEQYLKVRYIYLQILKKKFKLQR